MTMVKLMFYILAAIIGVALGDNEILEIQPKALQVQGTATGLDDIIAKYQPEIDRLTGKIILEAKIGFRKIELVNITIENSVENSAGTIELDISILKHLIQTNLKKPAAINNVLITTCLKIQLLYVNDLSITNLEKCYDNNLISELSSKNVEILREKEKIINLGESCKSQHQEPNEIEQCLSSGLLVETRIVQDLIDAVSEAILIAEQDAKTCLASEEDAILDKTNEIIVNSATCMSLT